MFGPIAIRRSQEYHKERETVIQMIQTIIDPEKVTREGNDAKRNWTAGTGNPPP
jgi:hypothetical protein